MYKLIVAVFIGFLFIIACKNKQAPFKSTSELQDEVASLKSNFEVKGFSSRLQQKSINNLTLTWVPLWDSTTKKVISNRQTFYYVPLTPTVNNGKSINLIGFRKYLLISKADSTIDYTVATYSLSIDKKNNTGQRGNFFYQFNGNMNAVSLETNTLYRYQYINGKVVHHSSSSSGASVSSRKIAYTDNNNKIASVPNTIASGHYESQCQTFYTCQWGASCGSGDGAVYITQTSGYGGCNYPLDDGTECDGSPVQWQLTSTDTQQDCQEVWVEDPPTPGGTSPTPTIETYDPCGGKLHVDSVTQNSIIQSQNSTLSTYLKNSPNEYGYLQNLTSLGSNNSFNTTNIRTDNSPTSVNLSSYFTWDSNNGYTIGFDHDHPDGSPPSPEDLLSLVGCVRKIAATANPGDTAFFIKNATVTVVTASQTYVVNIMNWTNFLNYYNEYQRDPNLFEVDLLPDVANNDWNAYTNHLIDAFSGSINVYSNKNPATGTVGSSYTPLQEGFPGNPPIALPCNH